MMKIQFIISICLLVTSALIAEEMPVLEHVALYKKGLATCIDGDSKTGNTMLRKAFKTAEEDQDYYYAWCSMWKLARFAPPSKDPLQKKKLFEQANEFAKKLDWTDANQLREGAKYIHFLSQMETEHYKLGFIGQAYVIHTHASKIITDMKERFSKKPNQLFSFEHNTPRVTYVYVLHLLDKASLSIRSGQILSAEQIYQKCIKICERRKNLTYRALLLKRTYTNYASLLRVMGLNEKAMNILELSVTLNDEDANSLPMDEVSAVFGDALRNGPCEKNILQMKDLIKRLQKTGDEYHTLNARLILAEMLLGDENSKDEAFAESQAVITEAASLGMMGLAAEMHLIRAQGRSANDIAGKEDDYLKALLFYREEANKPFEMGIYNNYSIVLNNAGDHLHALKIINEAIRLCDFMKLERAKPFILDTKADILLDLGCRDEAELIWEEIFNLLDKLHDLDDAERLRVMTDRIRYLARLDCLNEAAEYKKKTFAFADKSKLSEHKKKCLLEFNKSHVKPAPKLKQTNLQEVSLEPFYTSTRAVPGAPAKTMLWLSNPNTVKAQGKIEVSSSHGADIEQRDDLCVHVTLTTQTLDNAHTSGSVTLAPQAMTAVELIYPNPPTNKPETVTLTWHGHNKQNARWDIVVDSISSDLRANIHASILLKNQFFSIPVYHNVLPFENNPETPRNYRFSASEPCRLEIYDATTGDLLAIDADGNGSFMDRSDLLSVDSDLNGYPDTKNQQLQVICYIFLLSGREYGEHIDITFGLQEQDEWIVAGSDRLILSPTSSLESNHSNPLPFK